MWRRMPSAGYMGSGGTDLRGESVAYRFEGWVVIQLREIRCGEDVEREIKLPWGTANRSDGTCRRGESWRQLVGHQHRTAN
jgi:hypothetical protein